MLAAAGRAREFRGSIELGKGWYHAGPEV